MTDLAIVSRGDTILLSITLRKPAGSTTPYVNPGSLTAWMTLKRDPADSDAQAVWQGSTIDGAIVLADALDSRFSVTVPAAITVPLAAPTVLYWDVQVRESDGTITTVNDGRLPIQPDITRAPP